MLTKELTRKKQRLLLLDTFKDHDYGYHTSDVLDAIRTLRKDRFCTVLRDFRIDDDLSWVFHCISERGDMAVCIEELSFYCKANWSVPGIKELLRNSRHKRVQMICTSHVPSQIDKEIIQHSTLICGRMMEPNAVKYLRQIWDGADGLRDLDMPVQSNGTFTLSMVRIPPGETFKIAVKP